MTLTRLI